MPVMNHTAKIESSAPSTSARWYPKEKTASAGRAVIASASSETMKPATSLSMCAASVRIASEPARMPPTISIAMKRRARRQARWSLRSAAAFSTSSALCRAVGSSGSAVSLVASPSILVRSRRPDARI
jgi:hypothetical protein